MKESLRKKFEKEVEGVIEFLVNADKLRGEILSDSEDLVLYDEWQNVLAKAYDIVVSFADEQGIEVD